MLTSNSMLDLTDETWTHNSNIFLDQEDVAAALLNSLVILEIYSTYIWILENGASWKRMESTLGDIFNEDEDMTTTVPLCPLQLTVH